MEESTRKKIHTAEITLAVVLLLVSVLSFFPNTGITGFVSVETKTQELNLTIANSQSHILTTNNEKSFYLTSLKLSGKVIGEGIVKAYIDNGQGQRVLIYSNIVARRKAGLAITGMAVSTEKDAADSGAVDYLVIDYLENIEYEPTELAKDERAIEGEFTYQCIDSCFIDMMLNKDIGYQLLFYVEEWTILKVNEMVYTVRID